MTDMKSNRLVCFASKKIYTAVANKLRCTQSRLKISFLDLHARLFSPFLKIALRS